MRRTQHYSCNPNHPINEGVGGTSDDGFTNMFTEELCVPQNLWDTVKAVLRGRFIALQAYLKKQEKSQINNLTLHLRQLEEEEMKNPRVSRRKEILKIRTEINAKEAKETIAKINKAKSWSFEKIKLTNH